MRVYDEQGRVVREIHSTTQDPMWLPEDIDAALEWSAYETTICQGCGHSKLETMDPANEEAYVATAVRCWACASRDDEAASLTRDTDKKKGMSRHGLYFGVRKVGEFDADS